MSGGKIIEGAKQALAVARGETRPAVVHHFRFPRWQPIETAPKDGTWFLICKADDGFDTYEVGCYDPVLFPRFEEVEGGLYRKVVEPIHDWRGFNNMHRATHWMPLPEPPANDDTPSEATLDSLAPGA